MQGELEQKNILRVFTAAIFLCNMEIYYNWKLTNREKKYFTLNEYTSNFTI